MISRIAALAMVLASAVLVAFAAGCGGGTAEPREACTLPLAGTYEVLEHSVDPDGCTEGEPVTSLQRFGFSACPEGGLTLSRDGASSGCLKGSTMLTEQTTPDACSGGLLKSITLRRNQTERCGQYYDRVDAELEGDRVVLVLQDYEQFADIEPDADCPDFGHWRAGENLPPCARYERIVGRRLP